jgi:hypothetical protein
MQHMSLVLSKVNAPSQESYLRYLHPIPGIEYEDTVTIAPGVAIRQSIGVASNSSGINPYDGILG